MKKQNTEDLILNTEDLILADLYASSHIFSKGHKPELKRSDTGDIYFVFPYTARPLLQEFLENAELTSFVSALKKLRSQMYSARGTVRNG